MNEGENTGMPTAPNFSSPNASPDNVTPIQPATPAEPGQPTAPQQTASVYSAANSLPGEDPSQPSQVISSGPAKGAGARPHFGFSRKFKDQQPQQTRQATFSNAPDYFNQAVGDIVIADETAAARKQKTKKIALIAVAALAVLGGALAAVLVITQINKPSANKVQLAFNRYANYILYGEEKDSDIGEYSASTQYAIADKYHHVDEEYNKHFVELFGKFYKEYNAAAEAGLYEKGKLDHYKGGVDFIYASFEMERAITAVDFYKNYSIKGQAKMEEEIAAKRDGYYKTGFEMPVTYWYNTMISQVVLASAYNGLGCIEGGNINRDCASRGDSSIQEKNRAFADNYNEFRSALSELRSSFYTSLWDIRKGIK
ncbi:hypothetical protein J6X13_03865 [Candidatus Saccharibacteria bacterium]|nr:hypothetical protein [Candidatus Saccharibacteria bacterium]